MFSPAPAICASNPPFKFTANLLSTPLLTGLLFQSLILLSNASADTFESACRDMLER